MSHKLLPDVLYELGDSLGVPKNMEKAKVLQLLTIMDIQLIKDGFVHYNDFLFAVMKRKHAKVISKKLDKNSKKILAKENANTVKELTKIRTKYYNNLENKNNSKEKENKKNLNFFIEMIYVKTVFRS